MQFVIFEGLDGSGKSTLIKQLQQELTKLNQKTKIYQGLGSSSVGKDIRNLFLNFNQIHFLTRFFLSIANMTQIKEEIFQSNFENNNIVLIDRWLASTYAYQLFPYLNENTKYIDLKTIFNIIYEKLLLLPSLIIYLDINPKIGLVRKQKQANYQKDIIESKPISYFELVQKGYFQFLTSYVQQPILILNGDNSINFNVSKIIKTINILNNLQIERTNNDKSN